MAAFQSTGCNPTKNELLTNFLKIENVGKFTGINNLKAWGVFKLQEIPEIASAVISFLYKQALALSLQYNYSKQVFEKFYLLYLFTLSLMLTITEQILFTIKNSNKMLIDVNTLVKKPIEHNTFYKKKEIK